MQGIGSSQTYLGLDVLGGVEDFAGGTGDQDVPRHRLELIITTLGSIPGTLVIGSRFFRIEFFLDLSRGDAPTDPRALTSRH